MNGPTDKTIVSEIGTRAAKTADCLPQTPTFDLGNSWGGKSLILDIIYLSTIISTIESLAIQPPSELSYVVSEKT